MIRIMLSLFILVPFLDVCAKDVWGKGEVPRITDAAGGWGSYEEKNEGGRMKYDLAVKWGEVRIKSLGLELPESTTGVEVKLNDNDVPSAVELVIGKRCLVFAEAVELTPNQNMMIRI